MSLTVIATWAQHHASLDPILFSEPLTGEGRDGPANKLHAALPVKGDVELGLHPPPSRFAKLCLADGTFDRVEPFANALGHGHCGTGLLVWRRPTGLRFKTRAWAFHWPRLGSVEASMIASGRAHVATLSRKKASKFVRAATFLRRTFSLRAIGYVQYPNIRASIGMSAR